MLEIEGDRWSSRCSAERAARHRFHGGVRPRPRRTHAGRPDLVGRILDGMGRPADGGPELLPEAERDLNGRPVDPVAPDGRTPPSSSRPGFLRSTGCIRSVRGQEGPVFSATACRGSSWRHRSQRARACPPLRRGVRRGLRCNRRDRSRGRLPARPGSPRVPPWSAPSLFVNRAEEPVAERISCPRAALTAAEYLAFERGLRVLLVDIDELLRGAARGGRRSRRGAGPAWLSGLHVLRSRLAVRTRGPHSRATGVA